MRIRTRNIVTRSRSVSAVNVVSTFTRCDGNVSSSSSTAPAGSWNLEGFNERMEDALGKGSPHACKHRMFNYRINDGGSTYIYAQEIGGVWYKVSLPSQWHVISDAASGTSWLHNWSLTGTDIPPGWTISFSHSEDSLKEDCLEKAKALKADVLLNLVEANQIWPSIKTLANCLPEMKNNWSAIRKLIRNAPGTFLAWKFGVSPILSDIMNIVRYAPKIGQDLKRHRDGKYSRFASLATPSVLKFTDPGFTSSGNGYVTTRHVLQGRVLNASGVRYVLVVEPTVKYLDSFLSDLDFFMRRFASSPASLAWEKVPFSFVVDWFVDMRGMLRTLDTLLGFEPYRIIRFTRSDSFHLACDHIVDRFSPCDGSAIQSVNCQSVDYKHYARSLVPLGASAPRWKPRFGKNQAGISAALISQQLQKL